MSSVIFNVCSASRNARLAAAAVMYCFDKRGVDSFRCHQQLNAVLRQTHLPLGLISFASCSDRSAVFRTKQVSSDRLVIQMQDEAFKYRDYEAV